MKIVIQCAGEKTKNAGSFLLPDGRHICFIANPKAAPFTQDIVYARPDDIAAPGTGSWRERLVTYNKHETAKNPLNFLPAYKLYANPVYRRLVDKFGKDKVFILSAGWGLISCTFLTPAYDITFSASSNPLNRRKRHDLYRDFCMMEDDGEEMIFLGGKSYLPLFHALTGNMKGKKTVFYNSLTLPSPLLPNVEMVRFETTTRTNWHYECAYALVEDKIAIER